jgi:hypothetical protein
MVQKSALCDAQLLEDVVVGFETRHGKASNKEVEPMIDDSSLNQFSILNTQRHYPQTLTWKGGG